MILGESLQKPHRVPRSGLEEFALNATRRNGGVDHQGRGRVGVVRREEGIIGPECVASTEGITTTSCLRLHLTYFAIPVNTEPTARESLFQARTPLDRGKVY